jgi:hypothetical protein
MPPWRSWQKPSSWGTPRIEKVSCLWLISMVRGRCEAGGAMRKVSNERGKGVDDGTRTDAELSLEGALSGALDEVGADEGTDRLGSQGDVVGVGGVATAGEKVDER